MTSMRPSLCTKKRCACGLLGTSIVIPHWTAGASVTRFYEHGNIDDIYRAISLYRETLTLCPPGHPRRGISLGNRALIRCGDLHVSEDLDEAIDWYRECLQLLRLGHPERPVTLRNLSSALCSHFMQTQENGNVEKAITLRQQSLTTLSSLRPDHFSYMQLWVAYSSQNFRLASRHPTQGFLQRMKEAIEWARQAEVHQHESALEVT
ncbi:hypothetical protein EDD22DRAFT_1028062 [Suillus occidentalis]|nr:hypothetical protein EDD22DRAFT_1028062 [Suillus occidentalis]